MHYSPKGIDFLLDMHHSLLDMALLVEMHYAKTGSRDRMHDEIVFTLTGNNFWPQASRDRKKEGHFIEATHKLPAYTHSGPISTVDHSACKHRQLDVKNRDDGIFDTFPIIVQPPARADPASLATTRPIVLAPFPSSPHHHLGHDPLASFSSTRLGACMAVPQDDGTALHFPRNPGPETLEHLQDVQAAFWLAREKQSSKFSPKIDQRRSIKILAASAHHPSMVEPRGHMTPSRMPRRPSGGPAPAAPSRSVWDMVLIGRPRRGSTFTRPIIPPVPTENATAGLDRAESPERDKSYISPGVDLPKLAKVPPHPLTYTDINMDTAGDGPESPRLPSASALEDLFDKLFDWPAFSGAPQSIDQSSHYPSPPSSDSLPSPVMGSSPSPAADDLSLQHFEAQLLARVMDAFHHEVTSGPDYPYAAQTPPELIHGGSTSPSDHSDALLSDQDHRHHARRGGDVAVREDDAHDDDESSCSRKTPSKLAPHLGPRHLRRHIHQPGGRGSGPWAGQKRRRSGQDAEKRQRQLEHPLQTADVRKSGACLPCRVTKTRDPKAEERLRSCARRYIGKPREISIFLTKDTSSPSLRTTVQAYRSDDDADGPCNPNKADFPRDHVPSHEMLQSWVESQIRREHTSDFSRLLQSFLLAYAEGGPRLPQHSLVENVHKMNCFFRIWTMSSFWCRDPANHVVSLPLSVQARLRSIAREALKLLEYKVMKTLDDFLDQQTQPKPPEKVAIWASLWQLILMYRQLLAAFQAQVSLGGENALAYGHDYKQLTDIHFPLVAIFYHYQFRTKKSLELSLDWLDAGPQLQHSPRKKMDICRLGQELLDARRSMYHGLQASENDGDCLLCVLVVNHELKKLSARRRPSKASTKSKDSGKVGDCNDDDDDDDDDE
ncbi:hypothetical protein DCS_05634 [Drechmeria coniospora]|uniref:Uncharacterized protein n=1 Tax=Drechmeria coniospora TaxID=98403 RepID=A0A151GNC3_DRECN|nr:hypothetical protein DCS_05634 [Drechmeria coniospora]KYK58617.1 hypothetical protein DCS_05634 [Drechmeria coniospora]